MNQHGATIISICPFPIDEFKPGIIPSNFHVDAAKDGEVQVLNIGTNVVSRMRVPVMGNTIDMSIPAMTVARAIVEDRNTGQLYYSPEAKPGLFFVEGTYSREEAKLNFQKEIEEANRLQNNWFEHLVKLADDDWAKSKQHRYISDTQRYAARKLGLTKDWTFTATDAADKRCAACYSPMHALAIICPTCKTNQIEFAKGLASVPPAAIQNQVAKAASPTSPEPKTKV